VVRTGGAEGALPVGFAAAVVADEAGVFFEFRDLIQFTASSQFAQVELVVLRVCAEVVNVNQSIAHCRVSPGGPPSPGGREDSWGNAFA
jgi:hypothetical protein